jgi:hypothetical protein
VCCSTRFSIYFGCSIIFVVDIFHVKWAAKLNLDVV